MNMNKTMYLTYSSSLDKILELNSSFDTGILKVAYHGLNRNNSFISKESFERNINSMYNCPVVTNYQRDNVDKEGNQGDFGSHDSHLEIETDENDEITSIDYINDTQPIGVVYESSEHWWEEIEDDNGVHEYLCTNVILWKRQDAYNKLKQGKVFNHSMEIEITDGSFSKDGFYEIKDFQFTAFCILSNSVEPCFESSQIQVFNKVDFKSQFTEMMKELKETPQLFSKNQSSLDVDDINIHSEIIQEGGEKMSQVIIDETIIEATETVEEFTVTEVVEEEVVVEETAEFTEEVETPVAETEVFEEVIEKVEEVVVEESIPNEYELLNSKYESLLEEHNLFKTDFEKVKSEKETIESDFAKLKEENDSLKEFKLAKETLEKEEVFAKFDGLTEEEIAEIKEKSSDYTVEVLEEKLFAIWGKKKMELEKGKTFSKKDKKDKLVFSIVDGVQDLDAPIYVDIINKHKK